MNERDQMQTISQLLQVGTLPCSECAVGRVFRKGQFCPLIDDALAADSHLYRQGQSGDTIWLVKSGAIALEAAGTGDELAVRCPGSVVGLECLEDGTYRSHARAVVDTVVCRAPAALWREIFRERREWFETLLLGGNLFAGSESEETR